MLHNGPRAGINFNDGFMGGNIVENNLIFNWVRETQGLCVCVCVKIFHNF